MTRQLTLIRHAKSSWENSALSDFERPLNKRGLKNAPMMGRLLREAGIGFDLIVTSPARRALTTARIIAEETGCPEASLVEEPGLYGASVAELLDITQRLPDDRARVALVAHNPGLTAFCDYLCETSIGNLPTCGIACIDFELDSWAAVYRGTGRLVRFEYPRKASG